ncbi:MAG: PASTA domain-containing protein [Flavobacterium sp.]|nr:PASTA domain-containing protein [Pedobacter sp.]
MSKFFTYLGTRTFRKNLLIAFISVFALLLIIFYSLNFYTRHGEGLPVPKLKGLAVEDAIQLLESKGFRYQVDSVYLIDKDPGTVVEQDPDANTNVKINRTIYLTIITRLAPEIDFPDIDGKTFLEARSILNNYGLKLGDTSYISDVARDVVLGIHVKGRTLSTNQQVPKGSKIDLVLGDGMGASEVDIPNLLGLNLNEARLSLLGSSLQLGNVTYEGMVIDTVGARVIKQLPALSDTLSKVSIGSSVDVILSDQNQLP